MKKTHLSQSLSVFVLIGVLLLVGILGIYFDRFLKSNASEDMQKRMIHGYEYLVSELKEFESELERGIAFSLNDKYLSSSIDLVNNYQDKQKYNAMLLDEEKKSIAGQLLSRVKLSLNDEIALYDKNGELVSFVKKEKFGYRLNFFSYDEGKKILYSKFEDEPEYKRTPYRKDILFPFKHKSHYHNAEETASDTTTYHLYDNALCIKSCQNIITTKEDTIKARIEMSRCLEESYFETLSNIMDMQILLSQDKYYSKDAFTLFSKEKFKKFNILQKNTYRFAAAKLTTMDGEVYLVAKVNASLLNKVLVKNREQLLVMLFFITWVVLVVLHKFVNYRLTLPLQQLMEQIKKIEQRDYTITPPVETGDELESISHHINHLAETISQRESQLKASKKSLEFLSLHDPLTDLPNRRFFMSRLEHAIEYAKRNQSKLAVMFLDIDQFKHLNDTLGHNKGDKLLKKVSERLAHTLRSTDTLARIGGDEFNLLIENIHHVAEVETVVEKLLENFDEPYLCEIEGPVNITASIGIAMYPDDGEDTVTLIKHADMAMYQSKGERSGHYHFFSSKLAEYVKKKGLMVNALKAAISSGEEFVLQYQPQVSLRSNEIVGIEALVRWENATVGPLSVDEFVALAEETNFIIPLGKWIAQKACSDFVTLQQSGYDFKHVSINVSSKQLHHDDFVKMIQEIIKKTRIDPEAIEIEITETFAAQYKEGIPHALDRLRKMGIGLAVDDFGTGYSSMSYLQKLPVTRLKIDKSFLEDVPGSEENEAIIKASIALAKTFKLSITAEGIENEAQKKALKELGCDVGQGYYYAKPLDLEALKLYYKQHYG